MPDDPSPRDPLPGRRRALAGGLALAAAGLAACAQRPNAVSGHGTVGDATAPQHGGSGSGADVGGGVGPAEQSAMPAEPARPAAAPDPRQPPPAPREWRAAWIASVAQIDWPRRPAPSLDTALAEARALLDQSVALGLNALILQVRPSADALYASPLEPWSEFLTGRQGRAPAGGLDPLAWWVDQAHRRGLELHAWFNPYRARHSAARSPSSASHVARRRPDLVRRYGDQWWLDPGEPDAAAHTLAVIRDVATRYDIDGVHVDDYFYPYPVKGPADADLPFPDEPAWRRYRAGGGMLSRDDWRRDNVDRLVEALYRQVHAVRPSLRVGISPFGIGRPALRPPGVQGFSQYDGLYADVERWCAEGWFDYLAPQLYWPIASPGQPFEVLADHWLAHNPHRRHLWPGLFSDRVGKGPTPWPAGEVVDQIAALRRRAAAGIGGHCHFSLSVLATGRGGLAERLRREAYAEPALVPPTPWLDATPPALPSARPLDAAAHELQPGPGKPVWRWAVWRRRDRRWHFAVQPGADTRVAHEGAERIVVSAVDRLGNESAPCVLGPPGDPDA